MMRRMLSAIRRRVFPAPGGGLTVTAKFAPVTWFQADFDVRTLIDIGANDGAYGSSLSRELDVDHAYFFEPQQACLPHIRESSMGIRNVEIFNFALSDTEGTAVFHETNENPSASMLKLGEPHLKAFPKVHETSETTVPVRRLDDVLGGREMPGDILIKVDVQGVEDRVILGGLATFGRARIVLIEMSFRPMYEGQAMFQEVHDLLVASGLRLAGVRNQVSDIRPLFGHCIYVRPAA